MADYSDPYSGPNPVYAERDALKKEVIELKAKLATAEDRIAGRDPDSRGYNVKGEFFVCRFEHTVTDSMDAHDQICTKSKTTKGR